MTAVDTLDQAAPTIVYDEGPPRRYLLNGQVVPSVTQILGCLDKPALVWWGQGIGVKAVCDLMQSGEALDWNDPEGIVSLITAKKKSVNHVRDTAASRGVGAHTGLEEWAQDGTVPRPSRFAPEDRGYAQALAKALIALRPEPEACEVIVGSAVHGFAGRYDLRCRIDGKLCRLDLKTGKRVYDIALLQLAGYEVAALEMGEQAADRLLVLRLDQSGEFEVVESHATPEMFLGVKAAYDAIQALKAARPRKARASS